MPNTECRVGVPCKVPRESMFDEKAPWSGFIDEMLR